MRVPNGFITKKKGMEERLEDLAKKEEYISAQKALAIAVNKIGFGGGGYIGEILVWKPDMEKPRCVAKRDHLITSLCIHENLLYDAGYHRKVYDTLNEKVITTRNNPIMSLCSHEGELLDGCYGNIYYTRKGTSLKAERTGWVMALCSHEGELYDAGGYPIIYKTLTDKPFRLRKEWVYAICSHRNELFDSGSDYKIRNTTKEKVIAKRTGSVNSLCSFEDEMYDSGCYYSIHRTYSTYIKNLLSKQKLLEFKYIHDLREINALQPISFWLADMLLEKSTDL